MNYEWAKERLTEERETILARRRETDEYGLGEQMNSELSELSMYDNHPADIASELFERGKDLGLKITDKERLAEIERALDAIDCGTYGTCRECGVQIPQERLEANPASLLCVPCKRQEEQRHDLRRRPIEEEVLYPGYAQFDLDDTSNVAFDAEDAWQSVGRFNERPNDYEQIFMDDNEGIVDPVDIISNEEYKNQLP